jgi:hypothetical protein
VLLEETVLVTGAAGGVGSTARTAVTILLYRVGFTDCFRFRMG